GASAGAAVGRRRLGCSAWTGPIGQAAGSFGARLLKIWLRVGRSKGKPDATLTSLRLTVIWWFDWPEATPPKSLRLMLGKLLAEVTPLLFGFWKMPFNT